MPVMSEKAREIGRRFARGNYISPQDAKLFLGEAKKVKLEDLTVDQRLMLDKISDRSTPAMAKDFKYVGNRLGMSEREAIAAINGLVRLGLASKERRSRLRGYRKVSETYYYLNDLGLALRDQLPQDARFGLMARAM